uniref:Uncharacterized protein n=1 Tax=Anabas testudineus TaxID=64144 RepID=A0A3Q1J5U4_ANATE
PQCGPWNSSLKAQTQTFVITGPSTRLQPAVKASYGPINVDAPIASDLLFSGHRILPVILVNQVCSSSPIVKILFHMQNAETKDGAHCVTAYAFWEMREVRGSCLVYPGGFCVAQLKPEPAWFSSVSRSGSSSSEAGKTEGTKGPQGNLVEVYFQSRREQTGQCVPQDSLQRVGVGRGKDSGGSGTPMRRIGSVSLLRTSPGNPTFFRLRLGGAVVIQTSSKPLKTTDVATFYVFLASTSTLESFTLRGLLEVLQLDFFSPRQPESVVVMAHDSESTCDTVSVSASLPAQNTDILNTAVLTGKMVSVPVKTLAVEADGSVTDVTSYTSCRSTEEDVLKVSERCDYAYVSGNETRGKSRVILSFTYGFLSAQLEMSVWMPRVPLLIEVADPELSQIKGWRVPVSTGNRRSTWDSEEEDDMRKGRGCMLQYQHSTLRVLTPFIAQGDAEVLPDVLSPLTSSVLAERSIRVVDDKVSVTELGVQLVSGLSLSLQLSPGSSRAIVAIATAREMITQLRQEAVVSCWVQFSDGAVAPLELFDRSIYSLTASTQDERVATVRRTPLSTFVVAQGEGKGQAVPVRVELRICEECQKSKRKSKLAVGTGLLRINFQSSGRAVAGGGGGGGGSGDPPKPKSPKIIESDLIRTFRAMSDLEIGMYALVGVSCVAILAFLLNCASYNLCFKNHKTPIQAGPAPSADQKDHKHDWVWLGSNNHSTPAPCAPAQVSTLNCDASPTLLARPHRTEPLHSPTSKRNQVQFTTFTTLDIKHLAALKKNGVDLTWPNQHMQPHQIPAEPQAPLPDMPWPVVKPLGEPQ